MGDRKQCLYFSAILAFVAVYFGFGFLYALDKRDTSNVLYEVFRSKVLAAEKVDGDSRILLVGGSNVIWGFRSQVIEDATGIPTFNLAAMHEAYDPNAMRILTLSAVRPGDTVVYSSISFWNSRGTDSKAALEILKAAGLDAQEGWSLPAFKRTLDRSWSAYPQASTIITSLPVLWRRYILQEPGTSMQDLNSKGDLASCSTPGFGGPNAFAPPADPSEFLQALENFQSALHARGASLVLMLPPMLIVPHEKDQWLQGYQGQLHAMQQRFATATPFVDSSLYTDPGLFCDTGFHLGNEEAAVRSRTLARFLRERGEPGPELSKR